MEEKEKDGIEPFANETRYKLYDTIIASRQHLNVNCISQCARPYMKYWH